MIALNCGNVNVNGSDVQICDLQNSCLNAGDIVKLPISVCYMPCKIGPIKSITKIGNAILMDGDYSTLAGDIIVSNTCSVNNLSCSIVGNSYNSGTNITTIYTDCGFQDCPGFFCSGPECGILSIAACSDAAAVLTLTNTTTGEVIYTHTYEGEIDTYYEFVIPTNGIYSVSVVASQCAETSCEDTKVCEYTFKACPVYNLVKNDCHKYSLYDNSMVSKTNYVNVLGANGYSATYEFTVPDTDHVSFSTPGDGIYTVQVSNTGFSTCTGTCVNQNGEFDTDLNWWCSINAEGGYYDNASVCPAGSSTFEWSTTGAQMVQSANGDQPSALIQSCLTIGKTYCINFDVTNLNTTELSTTDSTHIEVWAGDTMISSTQMSELAFQDIELTTHHIYIPAITCTNTTNPLNNYFAIVVYNGGAEYPDTITTIDNVCIREVLPVNNIEGTFTQVLYDLCDMANCIKKLILDLFCNEDDPCCNDCDPAKQKAKELYRNELNKLNALYSTFSMMIEKEKADYLNVFTMDSCRELMITEIQSVFSKINEITKRCGDCDPKTNVTTPSSGCNGC
jgi:hypothetical protein